MSRENVEIVRASVDTWNAGDMDAWADFLAPDVVWRVPPDWPEQGPFAGREAVLRQAQRQREALDADTVEPISDFIHGADHVIVRFVWRGRGQGPEMDMEVTCIYTVRKARLTAFEFFWDHAEALEVSGLSE
jgi:ketosteroid isomerase-like protein